VAEPVQSRAFAYVLGIGAWNSGEVAVGRSVPSMATR
jgi:hypothetical protein